MTLRVVEGFEFDWFAVDRDGHVGHFSTAGSGAAPPAALAAPEQQDALFDAIVALPETTEAAWAPASHNIADWIGMARRGLYSFDAEFNGGPYELVPAPVHAVLVSDLPSEFAARLGVIQLDGVCFASKRKFEHAELSIAAQSE